ncbi:hypothetical protein GJ744_005034 [Endocarpon pusillum]|uniref:Methyltransferase domain-containing protein n=1 Tax=Endocarpon pusillum TaxID=364733 RepID=A0A8H7DYK8_9EURO|nr:hypothetical protein GJ744_005034 [Endocarpon pusillum]
MATKRSTPQRGKPLSANGDPPAYPSNNRPAHNPNQPPSKPASTGLSRAAQCALEVQLMYSSRAANYDFEKGGWHATLGQDFVDWLTPIRPGAAILDLACGTGLVALPAARAAGPKGTVVGVDVTPEMLESARAKGTVGGMARVEWVLGDVSVDLMGLEAVGRVVRERGGAEEVGGLLEARGRVMVDVPTEDRTVQFLWYHVLRREVGLECLFDSRWIKGIGSLEDLFENAGLEVVRSRRVKSYVPESWNAKEEMWDVFEKNLAFDTSFAKGGKVQMARKLWPEIWKTGLREDGRLWNGQALYVTIGKKPQ